MAENDTTKSIETKAKAKAITPDPEPTPKLVWPIETPSFRNEKGFDAMALAKDAIAKRNVNMRRKLDKDAAKTPVKSSFQDKFNARFGKK